MNKLLYWLAGFLPVRLIQLDGRPYLERYYLGQLFGVTFYLHRFVSSDTERHLHNHPWKWGRAIVLAGGYVEEFVRDLCPLAGSNGCVTDHRYIGFWNRVDGNSFHRIAAASPGTWTLFFHGPRQMILRGGASVPKGWGFLERLDCEDGPTLTVFRPFPSGEPGWWRKAPPGARSKREALPSQPPRKDWACMIQRRPTAGQVLAVLAAAALIYLGASI